jgi:hypothetical protein
MQIRMEQAAERQAAEKQKIPATITNPTTINPAVAAFFAQAASEEKKRVLSSPIAACNRM